MRYVILSIKRLLYCIVLYCIENIVFTLSCIGPGTTTTTSHLPKAEGITRKSTPAPENSYRWTVTAGVISVLLTTTCIAVVVFIVRRRLTQSRRCFLHLLQLKLFVRYSAEPHGPRDDADLRFSSPQPDTSLHYHITYTGLVHRLVCLFTPQPSGRYQIILYCDRGTWV